MANVPRVNATVRVTAKDINGNNIAKQFNSVQYMNFDYQDGTVNVVDATGSFYFPLTPLTTFTYVIVTGLAGSHTVVMS
jgi:hypothetical protein